MTFVCMGMWGWDGHFGSVGQQCEDLKAEQSENDPNGVKVTVHMELQHGIEKKKKNYLT